AAVLEDLAGADREDLALLRLVLGRVRQQDAAGGLLVGLEALDHDTVVERFDVHVRVSHVLGMRCTRRLLATPVPGGVAWRKVIGGQGVRMNRGPGRAGAPLPRLRGGGGHSVGMAVSLAVRNGFATKRTWGWGWGAPGRLGRCVGSSRAGRRTP